MTNKPSNWKIIYWKEEEKTDQGENDRVTNILTDGQIKSEFLKKTFKIKHSVNRTLGGCIGFRHSVKFNIVSIQDICRLQSYKCTAITFL